MTEPFNDAAPTYRDLLQMDRSQSLLLGLRGDDPETCGKRIERAAAVMVQWRQVYDDASEVASWHTAPVIPEPFGTSLVLENAGHVGATLEDERLRDALHKHMGGEGHYEWKIDEHGGRGWTFMPSGISLDDVDREYSRIVESVAQTNAPAAPLTTTTSAPPTYRGLDQEDRAAGLLMSVPGNDRTARGMRVHRALDVLAQWNDAANDPAGDRLNAPPPFGVVRLIEHAGDPRTALLDDRLPAELRAHMDRTGGLPPRDRELAVDRELIRISAAVIRGSSDPGAAQDPPAAPIPPAPGVGPGPRPDLARRAPQELPPDGATVLQRAQRRPETRTGWTPTPPSEHRRR